MRIFVTLVLTAAACSHDPSPRDPAQQQAIENTGAAGSDAGTAIELGKTLYLDKGCVQCHTVDGTPRVGPSWKQPDWGKAIQLASGESVTMDERYVRESILSPQAKARPGYPPTMPTFKGQLHDNEVTGLIAYIKSLKQP